MSDERTVRIAAIQATPVILDAEATVDKACGLLGEVAADGARLAVLPEAFVSLYPSNAWAKGAASFGGWEGTASFGGWDELWERLWESTVDVPGPLTEQGWPAGSTRRRARRPLAETRHSPRRGW